MSTVKVVRYRTKPEHAEENAELVRAVFAELAADDPGGLRYVTFRLEDGVTFVHVATIEGEVNPLASSAALVGSSPRSRAVAKRAHWRWTPPSSGRTRPPSRSRFDPAQRSLS